MLLNPIFSVVAEETTLENGIVLKNDTIVIEVEKNS